MPVLIQGGGGKPTVLFERVELTGFYLIRAYHSAKLIPESPDSEAGHIARLENSILTVMWSTLALEAGANSIAEDMIPTTDFKDFDKCRKKFNKVPGISSVVWKWHLLFKHGPKLDLPLDAPVLANAEKLVQLRHRLTHYSAQEASRKYYYDSPKPQVGPDGRMMMVSLWSADTPPTKVEPSLIESALSDNPAQHYMVARQLFLVWELTNGRDGSVLKEIPSL